MKKAEMDMTQGPLLKKILLFSMPLLLTNVLQLLFNFTDIMVLGIFVGDKAVAAVGANSSLTSLIVGLFTGISMGANVMIARCIGAKNQDRSRRFVGTSIVSSIIFGFILMAIGVPLARTFLELMSCAPEVIDMAVKYLQIYCYGMPFIMLYNFCASILRSAGDTVRPLIYLIISGVLNVGLNILFILVFNLTVEGVAIATTISQGVSALLCFITLLRSKGYIKVEWKNVRIFKREFTEMIKVGLPTGVMSCLFSLSNVIIQSSVNVFGANTMAGHSYGTQIEGFIYGALNGIAMSTLTFTSQNLGAGKPDRIIKTLLLAIAVVATFGTVLGLICTLFGENIVELFSASPEVISIAKMKLQILSLPYILCGTMDCLCYCLNGLGKSFTGMIVSLLGACVFRILWVQFIYPLSGELFMIYISYPISWALTCIIHLCFLIPALRKTKKQFAVKNQEIKDENLENQTKI